MRLKKLSLSLLILSGLTACSSTQVFKDSKTAPLEMTQRVSNGLNAIYEYPNFDYRGQVNVNLEHIKPQQTQQTLDPSIEKKLDQYLKQQSIHLSHTEKQALFQALVQQDHRYLSGLFGQGADVVQRILNDMQISYGGTVNYRQKLASFNLQTRYQRPNLLVEARIPTVLDLNEYRVYSQIFSLMPYLANQQDQDKFAYYDFSKYKSEFSKVDTKALVEFLKQSTALNYVVAEPNQVEKLSLSSADKQAGIVEKIRLETTAQEILLQSYLYAAVNRQYFMQSVLGLDQNKMTKILEDSVESEQQSSAHEPQSDSAIDDVEGELSASTAMNQLYNAVNRSVYAESNHDQESGDENTEDYDHDDDTDAQSVSDEGNSQQTEKILTEQQCESLAQTQTMARFGDVEYCQYHYEIDVLSAPKASSHLEQTRRQAESALVEKFSHYAQNQLVSADQFKQLWNQHQTEIETSLIEKSQRSPVLMDVALDAQGRAVKVDYDLAMQFKDLDRKLKLKFDLQFLNYGQASQIDRQSLKEAKPFKDIFKGSFMQKAIGGFAGKAALDDEKESVPLTLDERLARLAGQVFTQTHAYEKTYNAVFIAKLTAEKPALVKQYSAQDLQEIALIYAYSYSDEDVYNPKGKALQLIQSLKKKHHLEEDDQYDDELGNAVNEIVIEQIKIQQNVSEIQKLRKQYKTTQAVFAQYYMQKFEAENEVEKDQRAEYLKTVQVLAQAYQAFKKNQFNDQMVASLTSDSVGFIDYTLFKNTYQILSDAKLK